MTFDEVKNELDSGNNYKAEYGQAQEVATRQSLTRQSDKAEGGISIPDDVWSEIVLVAKYLVRVGVQVDCTCEVQCNEDHINPDPTVYDLFMWMREEMNGCQPFSDSVVERADREIESESGRGH